MPRDRAGNAPDSAERVRLHKVMARSGVASLRACERMILDGRVTVNDQLVTALGTAVDVAADVIAVDGVAVGTTTQRHYLLLNKPAGVLSAASDPRGARTVIDLVRDAAPRVRLFPVGRLDKETEGLLLITDDGWFAHYLMHPRYHVPKTYRATVRGVPDEAALDRLREGIVLDDGPTQPAEVRLMEAVGDGAFSVVEITIREGRKRQVRRMFGAIRHSVRQLERIAYGPLRLQGVERGAYRELGNEEVAALLDAAGASDLSGGT